MINFSPLRTARLQVTLRELSGRDAIALCQMPVESAEQGITELLKRIVVTPSREDLRKGQVTDQRQWSVQERGLVAAHYMAHVIGGDFQVGDNGRYSDYLMESGLGPPPEAVEISSVAGKTWFMQPLLGWHAEAIERLIFADELQNDRNGWLIGAMAAQIYSADIGPMAGHDETDAMIDKALAERANALVDLSESDLMALTMDYFDRLADIDHIFHLHIGMDGFCFLPAKKEAPGLSPARFPFSMALRQDTVEVFKPIAGTAGGDGAVPGPEPDDR